MLPKPWTGAVPVAEIDTSTFTRLRDVCVGISLPRLATGYDGEPVPLREFVETELLGPFGWFLYEDETGRICLGSIAEVYPDDSWETISERDICVRTAEDGTPIGLMAGLAGSLGDTIAYQAWLYDYPFGSDDPRQVLRYRHVQTLERAEGDNSDLRFEIRGWSRPGPRRRRSGPWRWPVRGGSSPRRRGCGWSSRSTGSPPR